jgi:DNA-directed RNA polymerase subunit RPC12/RpoP
MLGALKPIRQCADFILLVALALVISGCDQRKIDLALDSDANGYLCLACKTKFYTERNLFADFCPQCRNANIQQVVGFVCAADQHTTIAPRGPFLACEQCGKATSALSIPREKDLKAWGAAKHRKAEVTGN